MAFLLALGLSLGACPWVRDKALKAKIAMAVALAAFLVFLIWITRFGGETSGLVRPDGSVEPEGVRRIYEGLAFAAVLILSGLLMPPSASSRGGGPSAE